MKLKDCHAQKNSKIPTAQTADHFKATTLNMGFSIKKKMPKNKFNCAEFDWGQYLKDKVPGISHLTFLRNTADFFFYLPMSN